MIDFKCSSYFFRFRGENGLGEGADGGNAPRISGLKPPLHTIINYFIRSRIKYFTKKMSNEDHLMHIYA